MPKRIPIAAARRFAREHNLRQVIVIAWDGELTHVVTYGKTLEDCDQAATGGNKLKAAMGWPESLIAEPSRVRQLKKRLAEVVLRLDEKRRELLALQHLFAIHAPHVIEKLAKLDASKEGL